MKIKNKFAFIFGVSIILIMMILYFVKTDIDSVANYVTETSVLGIIIFYSPLVLTLYVLIALVLIVFGLRGFKKLNV